MDIQMPVLDRLQATRRIAGVPGSPSRVLVLTTFDRDDYILEALRAGASGFLLENCPPEDLVHAVRLVARGDALPTPSVTRRVVEHYVTRAAPATGSAAALQRLTDREREVLRLLADGLSNAELAHQLFVGEGTIKTHVWNILTKLGLRDRVQAVVYAYQNGLVAPGRGAGP